MRSIARANASDGTRTAERRLSRMRTLLPLAATLLLTACYGSTPPLNDIHVDLKQGEWAWCLSPSGEAVAWASSGQDAMGRTYGTCAPPNRFVRVRACGAGEVPADESPAALAARVRMSGDNSLVGDSFEGRPFCAPLPPN